MNKKDWENAIKHKVVCYDGLINNFCDLVKLGHLKSFHKNRDGKSADLLRDDSIDEDALITISLHTCEFSAWYHTKSGKGHKGVFRNGCFIENIESAGDDWPNNFTEEWINSLPPRSYFEDLSRDYSESDWKLHCREAKSRRGFIVIGKEEDLQRFGIPQNYTDAYGEYCALVCDYPAKTQEISMQIDVDIVECCLDHIQQ